MQDSLNDLIKAYKGSLNSTKIGVFLGAGISKASKIQDFGKFAFQAFQAAYTTYPEFRKRIGKKLKEHLDEQATLQKTDIEPEELFLLIKSNFRSNLDHSSPEWKGEWLHFCARQLYKNNPALENIYIRNEGLARKNWRIKKDVYAGNTTLQSIISFCLARSADFSDQSVIDLLNSSKLEKKVGLNPRIGGVLTTNYDNLFEATINHKFARNKGKEYGSSAIFEGIIQKNKTHLLEVQHIHGYLSHLIYKYRIKSKKELVDIVATETDFFKTFYESMSFSNYAGMRFFDSFHTIFIGCKMKDKNIRRFLYHMKEFSQNNTEKFAILRCKCLAKHKSKKIDTFNRTCLDNASIYTEEVLKAYGVKVIWVCNHEQIPSLLGIVYSSAGGNWKAVYDEVW